VGQVDAANPLTGKGLPHPRGRELLLYRRHSYKNKKPIPPTVETVGFLGNVFCELERQKGINKSDIRDLAWYRYGRYATQPLVVFLRDGRIFKIRTRKGNILIEKIK